MDNGASGPFSWSVGVPLGTNRLYLKKAAVFSAVLMACVVGVTLATQAFFGSSLEAEHLVAALDLGMRSVGLVALLWALVVFGVLDNRLLMRYRIGPEGVRCDTVRIKRGDWRSHRMSFRPFEAPDSCREIRSSSRLINWCDLSSAKGLEDMNTVVLRRGGWTVAYLFCPDRDTYLEVLGYSKGHL